MSIGATDSFLAEQSCVKLSWKRRELKLKEAEYTHKLSTDKLKKLLGRVETLSCEQMCAMNDIAAACTEISDNTLQIQTIIDRNESYIPLEHSKHKMIQDLVNDSKKVLKQEINNKAHESNARYGNVNLSMKLNCCKNITVNMDSNSNSLAHCIQLYRNVKNAINTDEKTINDAPNSQIRCSVLSESTFLHGLEANNVSTSSHHEDTMKSSQN